MNFLEKFNDIETIILDVDGVLTNGELLITEEGKLLRKMNVKDGLAMKLAMNAGIKVCIITGGNSNGVIDRLKALGIVDIYSGIRDKIEAYDELVDIYELDEDKILYMGDDLPDYPVMRRVGLPCCPADACNEVIDVSYYVSPKNGGEGCVRDVIEKILKLKGVWRY